MNHRPRKISGFTLIELMMVASIIGLLAAIALPKFGDMIIKAKEARVRGDLGMMRSAISIYYADNEGQFPVEILANNLLPGALTPKYIDAMPIVKIPRRHEDRTNGLDNQSLVEPPSILNWRFYSWIYPFAVPPSRAGTLYVNCSHTDSRGVIWSVQ